MLMKSITPLLLGSIDSREYHNALISPPAQNAFPLPFTIKQLTPIDLRHFTIFDFTFLQMSMVNGFSMVGRFKLSRAVFPEYFHVIAESIVLDKSLRPKLLFILSINKLFMTLGF